jgi:hypothetical protein
MKDAPIDETQCAKPTAGWLKRVVRRLFGLEPKPLPPPPWWWEKWQRIEKDYPIGRSFEYLGRRLLVVAHEWDTTAFLYGGWSKPQLATEYADEHGKLHEWYFHVRMFDVLLPPNDGDKLPP